MQLHDVHQGVHRRKLRKRVGRGIGSGHGKTSTKGHKGHASRQGFKLNPIFEGGQMPLARRVPKRGFFNGAFKKEYAIVNLDDIEASFEPGAVVDEAALRAKGLVKGHNFDGIKILGDGALTKALEVHATRFSGSAAAKIAAAGGKTMLSVHRPSRQGAGLSSGGRPGSWPHVAPRPSGFPGDRRTRDVLWKSDPCSACEPARCPQSASSSGYLG